ncbi:MAG: hypothetical protein H6733_12710 [Alphaproteobacteria bacterium]|nr:hypothetical protein [Alphaproteobacteria bacterium]
MHRPYLAPLVAVLALACTESTLTATNRAPTATIVSPAEGAPLSEGSVILLQGELSDPDNRTTDLTYTWKVAGEVACTGKVPDDDGYVRCEITVPVDVRTLEIVLVAEDPRGSADTDSRVATVTPTEPPEATITSPTAGERQYADHPVSLQATVADAEDPETRLAVTWASSLDGPLTVGTGTPDSAGRVGGYATLSEGTHEITVEVTDTTGKTGADSVVVTVGPANTAPTCGITQPTDDALTLLGRDVSMRGTVADDGQPPESLLVTWTSSVDGLLGSSVATTSGDVSLTTNTLSRATHTLTLTVTDDLDVVCTDAVTVRIEGPPDLDLRQPVADAVFRLGDPVRFEASVTDVESDPTDLIVTWTSDVSGAVAAPAPDATGLVAFQRSDLPAGTHQLTLRAVDPAGMASTRTVPFRVNTPPTTPVVDVGPSTPRTTDPLTASMPTPSTDADGDSVGYTWTWSKDGTPQGGLTGNTVPASATAKGQTWSLQVVPSDGTHSGLPAQASVTVVNAAPTIGTVIVAPSTGVRVGTEVTCSANTNDPDGDGLTTTYAWTDGSGATLGTGPTWTVPAGGSVPPGTLVTCTVHVDDSDGGQASRGASLTTSNALPTVRDVTIAPSSDVLVDTALSCTATVADPDGGTPAVSTLWTKGATQLGAGPSLVLSSAIVAVGDTVTCTVTAEDTLGGTGSASASVPVVAPRPSIDGVVITTAGGEDANRTSTLRCASLGFVDPEGDPERTRYQWRVGATGVGTGPTLANTFVRGDTVTCTGTPSDGTTDGNPRSASVIIGDAPPSIAGVAISPDPAAAFDTLTCHYTGFSDPDGDVDASTFAWAVNGTPTGTTNPVLGGGYTMGDTVTCAVTPRTANGGSAPLQSASLRINTPPEAATVVFDPPVPGVLNDLGCLVDTPAPDADGDVSSYEIAWFRNGSPTAWRRTGVPTGQPVVVPASQTARGQTWRCEVTPFDGLEYGPMAWDEVSVGCPAGSGHEVDCPGTSCADILDGGFSYGDGVYWIDDGDGPYEVTCDMTGDGGGWTLVMTTSDASPYTYDHPVWTDTSGGVDTPLDPDAEIDAVASAFYTTPVTETRLCLPRVDDGVWTCKAWTHDPGTPRDLANGPVIPAFQGRGIIDAQLLIDVVHDGIWTSDRWSRVGWSHGTSPCGGLRVGFTGDNDATDSRDSGIGIGIYIVSHNCNPSVWAGFSLGSGYYHYPWPVAPTPNVMGVPARLWVR